MEDGAVGVGVEENLGQIQFSIHYEFTEQTLVIRVLRAKGLPAKDFRYADVGIGLYNKN